MPKHQIGSKGAGEWSEVLMTVLIAACIMFLVFKIPEIVRDVATLLSLASAEATARDLAGLITISRSAQDSMTITYEGADEMIFYDVEIKDRIVYITNIRKESGEIITGVGDPMKTGWGKIAVGDLSEEFADPPVNVFTIKKNRVVEEETYDDYDVSAY